MCIYIYIYSEKLPTYLQHNEMTQLGLDYNLMAVFGPQSSGKSTLLNKMFQSHFDTMDSTRGRYQVTKGVCVSKAINQDILIMDLEGTDSKERGEENMAFEKKISLFALAISEVLLVNMWMQDIGRYNASNFSLLKTVFELNLQLFQKDRTSKTLLLFCIRDHIEQVSSLAILKKQLMIDIDKIWAGLIQPEMYRNSNITDFFDIEFVALPHKLLMEQEFDNAVDKLKERFVDPTNEGYFFKPEYKKSVPIDGFQFYAVNIWNVILHNKDLDLPTQKEMLATFRCSDISNEVFVEFEKKCEVWDREIKQRKLVKNLGVIAREEADHVLSLFTQQTLLYASSVVQQKKELLMDRMKQSALNIFGTQMLLVRENAVKFYQGLLEQVTKEKNTVLSDFNQTVDKFKTELYAFFEKKAQESIFAGEEWDYSMYELQLTTEVDRVTEEQRRNQIRILMDNQKHTLSEDMKRGLSTEFKAPSKTFWVSLRQYYDTMCEEVCSELKEQLSGFNASEEEVAQLQSVLRAHASTVIRHFTDSYVNQLSLRINNRYDEMFRINRGWKSLEDIQQVHNHAVAEALQLLDLFFLYRLIHPEFDHVHLHIPSQENIADQFKFPELSSVAKAAKLYQTMHANKNSDQEPKDEEQIIEEFESNILLDDISCTRIYSDFITRVQNSLQNAQDRFALLNSSKSIPMWMYVLVLVLGWNEIMYFIKSPFWLFVIIVFGSVFGWVYIKNWVNDYIENGSNEILKMVLRIVLQRMESFAQSDVAEALKHQVEKLQQQIQQQPSESRSPVISHQTYNGGRAEEMELVEASSPIETATDVAPQPRRRILDKQNISRSSVRFSRGVSSSQMNDLQTKIEAELNGQ